MSSYTNHMKEDEEWYRGVIAYEVTQCDYMPNPNFDPHKPSGYNNQAQIYGPTGAPDETVTTIIGPYNKIGPIKSYITRNRKYNNNRKNLRILRIEKVTGWEEVSI